MHKITGFKAFSTYFIIALPHEGNVPLGGSGSVTASCVLSVVFGSLCGVTACALCAHWAFISAHCALTLRSLIAQWAFISAHCVLTLRSLGVLVVLFGVHSLLILYSLCAHRKVYPVFVVCLLCVDSAVLSYLLCALPLSLIFADTWESQFSQMTFFAYNLWLC